jgi:hypothetical protein
VSQRRPIHNFQLILVSLGALSLISCASKILEYKNVEKLEENVEYEELIQVKEIPGQKVPESTKDEGKDKKGQKQAVKPEADKKSEPKQDKVKTPVVQLQPTEPGQALAQDQPRQPEHEDAEGFSGRRPIEDPFRVGEKIRFSVSYFRMTAGYMDLKVNPYVEVNGKKSYSFEVDLRTTDFFSRIYTVDDVAQTFLDFETLLPYNMVMKVRESKQIKEVRSVFNHNDLKASYWSKKFDKDGKEKEKKVKWEIKPYSQNVVSALYYLRTFKLNQGKKLKFRVADDGKNFMFTGEVVRKEKLKTDAGTFDTVVVKTSNHSQWHLQANGRHSDLADR